MRGLSSHEGAKRFHFKEDQFMKDGDTKRIRNKYRVCIMQPMLEYGDIEADSAEEAMKQVKYPGNLDPSDGPFTMVAILEEEGEDEEEEVEG
jgi:hypothetical protein